MHYVFIFAVMAMVAHAPLMKLQGNSSPGGSTISTFRPKTQGAQRLRALSSIAEGSVEVGHDQDHDLFDLPPIPAMKNAISR